MEESKQMYQCFIEIQPIAEAIAHLFRIYPVFKNVAVNKMLRKQGLILYILCVATDSIFYCKKRRID